MSSQGIAAGLVFVLLLAAHPAVAGWTPYGTPVCTAPDFQGQPEVAPDGAGGAIIAWHDYRDGVDADIYVQRVDPFGNPVWTPDGVPVTVLPGNQWEPAIISDDAGGAIIAWEDHRGADADIYAQRVDASGNALWAANGVSICSAGRDQISPGIIPDGIGGGIIAWGDLRTADLDIYAQRVNLVGTVHWVADGVSVVTATGDQSGFVMVSDGASGVIVVWNDFRNPTEDVYANRVDFLGNRPWPVNGVPVCTAAQHQYLGDAVADGSGGAIIAWSDLRNASAIDIYGQRVLGSGAVDWAVDGVPVCTAGDSQQNPRIAPDESGGAVVAWEDLRSGVDYDVYAQRVNASGVPRWTADGVEVCSEPGFQGTLRILPVGSGESLMLWQDFRTSTSSEIYAQRLDAIGNPFWTGGGVLVASALDNLLPHSIAADEGVFMSWGDDRYGDHDIFVQRMEGMHGFWGHPEPGITSVADIPGDQGGLVAVNWAPSGWDVFDRRTVTHYSVWRAADAVSLASASSPRLVDPGAVGPDFRGTACYPSASGEFYWEWVANQEAYYLPGYSFSAATRSDSTAGGIPQHYFQVVAHTSDQFLFWPSGPDSGYSTDDLAPAAPLQLQGQRVGTDVALSWEPLEEPDLAGYSVYRGETSGFPVSAGSLLSTTSDSMFTDATATTEGTYYYRVTGLDIHDNEGPPSNEVEVSPATGIENRPGEISRFLLLPNVPNPFSTGTRIRFGLPERSSVTLRVMDLSGRLIHERSWFELPGGWQSVPFEGRDLEGRELPRGVYLYRVSFRGLETSSASVATGKMVRIR